MKFLYYIILLFLSLSLQAQNGSSTKSNWIDTETVHQFIKDSWTKTIRSGTESEGTFIGLPHSYTVPSISGSFQEMYYWDTYFTGEGLILDGYIDLAKNNAENMIYMIGLYGKMLNGNRTFYENRSQPPYLSMMIESIYRKTGDKQWLKRMLPELKNEYLFWTTKRQTPIGLSHYSSESTLVNRLRIVSVLEKRMGDNFKNKVRQLAEDSLSRLGAHFIAECESGWDFNPRYDLRCEDFCPIDLNANLYYYEKNFEFFFLELNNNTEAMQWAARARERQTLIYKYCYDADRQMFYDYDFVNNKKSAVISAAVFSLFYAKVINYEDAEKIKDLVLSKLEYPFGISACENKNYGYTYQWSYPNGWAPLHYLAIKGLDNYRFENDAQRIASKYVTMIASTYKETNNLWEKYNVVEGNVNVTNEYKMPSMIGWTAGTFVWAYNYLKTKIN